MSEELEATRRSLMRLGSDRADDPAAAGQQPGPANGSPSAATALVDWHGDLMGWADRLGWLGTWSDRVAAVLVPIRERHQDNLLLELMDGGRRGGPPNPPPLSD